MRYPQHRSLSSRRAWIEIQVSSRTSPKSTRRSPHGERGLKSIELVQAILLVKSLSSRRAWIEIGRCPSRSAEASSLSSRRAWIEIPDVRKMVNQAASRSPHGERGLKSDGIDADVGDLGRSPHGERGLKYATIRFRNRRPWSLSSRRAWIEIGRTWSMPAFSFVALLTESVD